MKSAFQRSGIRHLAQFGTYPVTASHSEELMQTALDGIRWRKDKTPVGPAPFASFRCPYKSAHSTFCVPVFFFLVKQFHSPTFHLLHPTNSHPGQLPLPGSSCQTSATGCLFHCAVTLLCRTNQGFTPAPSVSTRNLSCSTRKQKVCIMVIPCSSAAPHSHSISHSKASFETSAWQPTPVSRREPEKYVSSPLIPLRHFL